MKRISLLGVLLAVITSGGSAGGQNNAGKTTRSANAESVLDGDWRGESVCVVPESACVGVSIPEAFANPTSKASAGG